MKRKPVYEEERKRKTKPVIMSLYKEGPQLVTLSDPLFDLTITRESVMDLSCSDLGQTHNELNICSIVDAEDSMCVMKDEKYHLVNFRGWKNASRSW